MTCGDWSNGVLVCLLLMIFGRPELHIYNPVIQSGSNSSNTHTCHPPAAALSLLERDKPRRVGSADARLAVLDWLVRYREFAKVVAHHVRLDLHLSMQLETCEHAEAQEFGSRSSKKQQPSYRSSCRSINSRSHDTKSICRSSRHRAGHIAPPSCNMPRASPD